MPLAVFFAAIGFAVMLQLSGTTLVNEQSDESGEVLSPAAVQVAGTRPVTVQTEITPAADTVPIEQTAPTVPQVTLRSPQNIEAESVLLRGVYAVGDFTPDGVFFILGYQEGDVQRATSFNSYDEIRTWLDNQSLRLVTVRVPQGGGEVSTRVTQIASDTTYYVRLCMEVQASVRCTSQQSFTTPPRVTTLSEVQTPRLSRIDEDAVSADSAELHIRIDMRDTVDGRAYVVYGESQELVDEARGLAYTRIEEEEELLQKVRVASHLRGMHTINHEINDLAFDSRHYYAWCVSYDGEKDGVTCTRTQSFATHSETFGETPSISPITVVRSQTTAQLSGSVVMRDFLDGVVFFVYGTDDSLVRDTVGEQSFSRIRQREDRLQKRLVDRDLDGRDSYSELLTGLQSGATYTFALCVEYENENDRYRDVAFITCSDPVVREML